MDSYKEFGYKCLGPLLFGFSHWLYSNIKKEQIEKIYFFSRDGYIMKQAFDMLFNDPQIKSYYLEVSRRSLRVPILWKDYSLDVLLTMLGPSQLITLRSIFDSVGLNIDDYQELISKYHFNNNTCFYRKEIKSKQDLINMYNELSNDIYENSIKEFGCLKKYISQYDIKGKIAIVDIGWSGGMQRFLQTTLKEMNIETEILGYYTGVADYYKRNISEGMRLNMNGYLFDFSHNPKDIDCRSCFVGLYEMLFLETKGSVKKYVINDEGIASAERYDSEYYINGEFLDEIYLIKKVQEGALSYIYENKNNKTINKNDLSKPLLNAGQKPTKEAIQLFANFRFFDEGEYLYLATPKKLFYYIKKPHNFKIDFYKSRWKTAFLKNLFKIPLPYFYIYKVLKNISK